VANCTDRAPTARGTSAFESGVSTDPHLIEPCSIRITSSSVVRSFQTAEGLSEIFDATLTGRKRLGAAIRWDIVPLDRPPEGFLPNHGTVVFSTPDRLSTLVFAGRPNRGQVRVRYERADCVLCEDKRNISVPQIFSIGIREFSANGFFGDLERLGLRRPPSLTTTKAQQELNDAVYAAVKDEMYRTARNAFEYINVRFLEFVSDPGPVVRRLNNTTITVGGIRDRSETAYGLTYPPQPLTRAVNSTDRGDPRLNIDTANRDPRQRIEIQSGWFTAAGERPLTSELVYNAIFGKLAVRNDRDETLPDGRCIDVGEWSPTPKDVRQRTVHTAVIAFGRFLGRVIAHECAHALGLDHNVARGEFADTGELMDHGTKMSFADYTGIRSFDPTKGVVNGRARPAQFSDEHSILLQDLLPLDLD
jgi:hypothetical protein